MWADSGHADSALVLRAETGMPMCLQEEVEVETNESAPWTEALAMDFLSGCRPSLDLAEIFGRQIPGDFYTSGWKSPWTGKSKIKKPSALKYPDIMTS